MLSPVGFRAQVNGKSIRRADAQQRIAVKSTYACDADMDLRTTFILWDKIRHTRIQPQETSRERP
jgi:hypothetical protein